MDTSGFYALLVARDRMHARACGILRQAARLKLGFVTTDYVLDEAATLFRARGHGHLAAPLFETVQASAACSIEWMDPDRFEETRRFFMKHGDQDWSFTDSFSFLVMREKKIRDALTSDRHFREAGCNALLL